MTRQLGGPWIRFSHQLGDKEPSQYWQMVLLGCSDLGESDDDILRYDDQQCYGIYSGDTP